MTVKRRVKQLEEYVKPGCNRVLLRVVEGDNTPGPTREAIEQYLTETGLCENCPGKCILVWWDDDQRFTVMEQAS